MKFGHVDQLNDVTFELPPVGLKTINVLEGYKKTSDIKFNFGAPGFSDVKFKGILYPSNTPQKRFLEAYAKQFNSIEVNATRYGTPKINVLNNWIDQVPDSFKFSLKVPQVITHRKNINDSESKFRTDQFLAALFHLGQYSGISFAVMANYFKAEQIDNLESFINYWPKDQPLAIELRHPSWFEGDAPSLWQDLFVENNIIPVITDTPGRRDVLHMNLSNDQLFIRYVGDFNHPSDIERTNTWIERIKDFDKMGVNNIWFYVHQPGDKRERILYFFNNMIPKINNSLGLQVPLLENFS